MEPSNIVYGRTVGIDVHSKQYSSVTRCTTDEDITTATIEELADLLIPGLDERNASILRDLKVKPINAYRCQRGINLIDNHPLIVVVNNQFNYHAQSDLFKFTWERVMSIHDSQLLALVGSKEVEALKIKKMDVTPLITVSQGAYDAMNRHLKVLQQREANPISIVPRRVLPLFDEFRITRDYSKADETTGLLCDLAPSHTVGELNSLGGVRRGLVRARSLTERSDFFTDSFEDKFSNEKVETKKSGLHSNLALPAMVDELDDLENESSKEKIEGKKCCTIL